MSDGKMFQCAKRKEILDDKEDFFGHKSILPDLHNKVKIIFAKLNCEAVFVYGEIFGGSYPHNDVKPIVDVYPVQTGVYYSPKIEFCAFDLQVQSNGVTEYLDYDKALVCFREAGLFYAQPLFIGKYELCLNYDFHFVSTIPKLLGYPSLKNNKAEGIVIKPMRAIYTDGKKGKTRVILKLKPTEFLEKQYHQAEKWTKEESNFEISEYTLLTYEILSLITDQRIDNCVSKIGKIGKSNIDQLCVMYHQDVLESLLPDNDKQYNSLSPSERSNLTKFIETESKKQIKTYFTGQLRKQDKEKEN